MALSWLNLPCALKAAIGIGKRTLGDPRQAGDGTAACPLAAGAAELSISTMPAEASRITPDFFLALRRPKLSRRCTDHVTEMTRQMTLVRKAGGIRNFR